jgi:hypothetical protein
MATILVTDLDATVVDDLKDTAAGLLVPAGVLVSRLLDLHHALQFAASTSADAELRGVARKLLRDHQLI